jgi:hypothetical protein
MEMSSQPADAHRTAEIVNLRLWHVRHLLDDADGDVSRLRQAYQVLGELIRTMEPSRRGRPPGSGTYTRKELLVLVARQAKELHRAGHRPTLAIVATALAWSRGGLSRALKRQAIDWRRIRADVERRAA